MDFLEKIIDSLSKDNDGWEEEGTRLLHKKSKIEVSSYEMFESVKKPVEYVLSTVEKIALRQALKEWREMRINKSCENL